MPKVIKTAAELAKTVGGLSASKDAVKKVLTRVGNNDIILQDDALVAFGKLVDNYITAFAEGYKEFHKAADQALRAADERSKSYIIQMLAEIMNLDVSENTKKELAKVMMDHRMEIEIKERKGVLDILKILAVGSIGAILISIWGKNRKKNFWDVLDKWLK